MILKIWSQVFHAQLSPVRIVFIENVKIGRDLKPNTQEIKNKMTKEIPDNINASGCKIIIKQLFKEIREKVTHIKPCCELTLNAIEKKYTK